jgi:excisionase family DNA binding protein
VEARESKYVVVQEIADELGVDLQTVRRWIHAGRLPAIRPGQKFLVLREDLDAFLEERATGPKGAAPSSRSRTGKTRLGNVVSQERLDEVEVEHDQLNAALEAGEITPAFYTRRMADLYSALIGAAGRASKEAG